MEWLFFVNESQDLVQLTLMYILIKVFFDVLCGAYAMGQTSPNIQAFANARGAAFKVYNIIDQVRKTTLFCLFKANLSFIKPPEGEACMFVCLVR